MGQTPYVCQEKNHQYLDTSTGDVADVEKNMTVEDDVDFAYPWLVTTGLKKTGWKECNDSSLTLANIYDLHSPQ